MLRVVCVLILLQATIFSFAAKVTITGTAKGYEGKAISLITYKDHVSMLRQTIAKSSVDKNGKFEITAEVEEIEFSFLKIGTISAIIYLQPDAHYWVTFPLAGEELAKSLDDTKIEMIFDSLEVTDINNLILDFDYRYDYFVTKNMLILNKPEFKLQIDTFKQKITHVYRDIKNPWFRDYVYYSTATLEMMSDLENAEGLGKAYVYEQYLRDKKIDYTHEKYMHFFNQFYYEPFSIISADQSEHIETAINEKASMKLLSAAFEKSTFTRNKDLRELVIIKGLLENYYREDYEKTNILIILDSLSKFAGTEENREVANNVYTRLTYLSKGSKAPDFKLKNLKGDTISLSQFKGKFVYLSFWTSWSTSALSEMKLYPGYQKRYGGDIVYISINMDENKEDFRDFMTQHPDYNWYFLDGNSDNEIWDLYQVKSIPEYFLIDECGNLRQSPALRPLPSGTFKSIDETLHNLYWNKKRGSVSDCDD